MVLNKPTITATTGYNADEVKQGVIVFAKGEEVKTEFDNQGKDWINIVGSYFQPNTKKSIYFEGWIPVSQLSESPEYIDFALMYENALSRIAKCDEKNINEGRKMLQRLIDLQDNDNGNFLVEKAMPYVDGMGDIYCE